MTNPKFLDVAMRLGPFNDQHLADRHELLASHDPPQRLDLLGRLSNLG